MPGLLPSQTQEFFPPILFPQNPGVWVLSPPFSLRDPDSTWLSDNLTGTSRCWRNVLERPSHSTPPWLGLSEKWKAGLPLPNGSLEAPLVIVKASDALIG